MKPESLLHQVVFRCGGKFVDHRCQVGVDRVCDCAPVDLFECVVDEYYAEYQRNYPVGATRGTIRKRSALASRPSWF